MNKVTINQTSEQQDKAETGEHAQDFTYEALESRDTPKFSGGGLADEPAVRGGGKGEGGRV